MATIGDDLDLEIRASEHFRELTVLRASGGKLIVSMPLETTPQALARFLVPFCEGHEISEIVELWSTDDAHRDWHIDGDQLVIKNPRPTT
jgi:hypothetical protein